MVVAGSIWIYLVKVSHLANNDICNQFSQMRIISAPTVERHSLFGHSFEYFLILNLLSFSMIDNKMSK